VRGRREGERKRMERGGMTPYKLGDLEMTWLP